jgi:hypothetical protein
LEKSYPSYTSDTGRAGDGKVASRHGDSRSLDKTNTVMKLVLDQTISAAANTAGWIAAFAVYRGKDLPGTVADLHKVTILAISSWTKLAGIESDLGRISSLFSSQVISCGPLLQY